MIPLAQATEGLGALRQSTYAAYRQSLGDVGANLPDQFSDTVTAVAALIDPVLAGLAAATVWNPTERQWSIEEEH